MQKTIGILTGGGDAPGLNAVIRAVVKTATGKFGMRVIGIEDGFEGLLSETKTRPLSHADVRGLLPRGGTILGTRNRGRFVEHSAAGVSSTSEAVYQEAAANIEKLGITALLVLGSCERQERPVETNFYQRRIGPILEQSCAEGPAKAGCHVRADEKGNALGNLSLESYDDLAKRPDLLINYGPYGMPGMLVKAVPPFKLALTSWKSREPLIIDSNIAHVGGSLIDITSSSFTQLQACMENGAAENAFDLLITTDQDLRYQQNLAPTAPRDPGSLNNELAAHPASRRIGRAGGQRPPPIRLCGAQHSAVSSPLRPPRSAFSLFVLIAHPFSAALNKR